MRFYCGQTRSRSLIETLTAHGIGEVSCPNELPPRRRPWFLDNGAYRAWTAGRAFDEVAFMEALELVRAGEVPSPDFIVAPDVVAGGTESLRFSLQWVDRLEGLRAYLAVQDGMDRLDVECHLASFAGIFVGGTLRWKLATMHEWCYLAHEHVLRCHIGRCGPINRLDRAWAIGADSIDSSLPLFSRTKLTNWLCAKRFMARQRRFAFDEREVFAALEAT